MLLSVLLQAAAAGVGVSKLGAALGAGLAVIGAGIAFRHDCGSRRTEYRHPYIQNGSGEIQIILYLCLTSIGDLLAKLHAISF